MGRSDVVLSVSQLRSDIRRQLYGETGLSFEVLEGDFLVILGKSGCGKTTLLEMILGTRPIVDGKVRLCRNGVLETLQPGRQFRQRNFGVVFQDYGLFEEKSVMDNLTFPLRLHGISEDEWKDHIDHVVSQLELNKVPGLLDRKCGTLSGGEKQRVALARMLCVKRRLYLFDEPLSNIDNPLRQTIVRNLLELKGTLKGEKAAAIYVTHNQDEALSLANRIMVLRRGSGVEQDDTPVTIYCRPETKFVAEFVGDPAYNIIYIQVMNHVVMSLASAPLLRCSGGKEEVLAESRLFDLVDQRKLNGFREPRLAVGFRPAAVVPESEFEPGTEYIMLDLELDGTVYQGEHYVLYGRDDRHDVGIRVQIGRPQRGRWFGAATKRVGVSLQDIAIFACTGEKDDTGSDIAVNVTLYCDSEQAQAIA